MSARGETRVVGINTVEDDSRLRQVVSKMDKEDARSRYREEVAESHPVGDDSPGASSSEEERKFVAWEVDDPENPYNWSKVCVCVHMVFWSICDLLKAPRLTHIPGVDEEGLHRLHDNDYGHQFYHGQLAPE